MCQGEFGHKILGLFLGAFQQRFGGFPGYRGVGGAFNYSARLGRRF